MNPQVFPAAMILCAFIGLCLVVLCRWMDREMNRK